MENAELRFCQVGLTKRELGRIKRTLARERFKTDNMMKRQKNQFRKGLVKKLYELEILLKINWKQRIKKHEIGEVVCSVINLN